jgi:dihydrofolate reductase
MSGLFLVAARAANGVIGRDNALPWRLLADLKRFKALTMGCAMIMGRRTFESIGRPLPGRRTIILSRTGFGASGTETAVSLADALALAGDNAAIVGGEAVFADALPFAGRLELTEVHAEPPGDARFPPFDEADWRETWREEHPAADGQPAFTFRTLLRR